MNVTYSGRASSLSIRFGRRGRQLCEQCPGDTRTMTGDTTAKVTTTAGNPSGSEMDIFPFQEEESDGMYFSASSTLSVDAPAAKHGLMCRHDSQNSVLTGSELHVR